MRKALTSIASIFIVSMAGVPAASAMRYPWIPPPTQTTSQKRLAQKCYSRSESHLNDPFEYPLAVSAFNDPDTLGVFVDPARWKTLPRSERVNLLRDVACWYSGGRMVRRYWYDFGAIDPTSNRAIEVFRATELWPKSGHYK